MLNKYKSIKGITLIALIVTVLVLLILVAVMLNMIIGENGIIVKAQIAKENTNRAEVKENLQVMLLEIKTRIITEEKRNTKVSDCDELQGRDSITKIEYITDEQNNQHAQITYKKYIFTIDDDLKIIDQNNDKEDENQEDDEDLQEYKKEIAQTITNLGVKTSYTQTSEDYINNIKLLADKNYNEGKESDIVCLKTNLESRYVQTISLSHIEGYENFDVEDFIIVNKNMTWAHTYEAGDILYMSKTYNKQTGNLTLGQQKVASIHNRWTYWNTFDLYAIKRNIQEVTGSNVGNKKENLQEFKNRLSKAIQEYGIENDEESSILEKTPEEISEYIKKIARKKFEEGVATYKILIQADLSSRSNQTVSVSNVIENYNTLTIDDFLIVNTGRLWTSQNDGQDISVMTKTYNSDIGTLEFGMQKGYTYIYTQWNTYDVYLLKKQVINLES